MPIVSYLISPQLIDRIFLPVPVLTAFKDIVIELEESAVIVAPVAVPGRSLPPACCPAFRGLPATPLRLY